MMPQPMAILLVSRAMIAVVAVEERASRECLRHQGYASASQKTSKPAASQACAICTVSLSGSMLNCRTPILNGRRSEEHTSELQSRRDLVCRLLLEKKKEQYETGPPL